LSFTRVVLFFKEEEEEEEDEDKEVDILVYRWLERWTILDEGPKTKVIGSNVI
jgi:hypothetical protein